MSCIKKNGYRSRKKCKCFILCVCVRRRRRKIIHMVLYEDVSLLSSRDARKTAPLLQAVHCCPHMASRAQCSLKRKLKVLKKKLNEGRFKFQRETWQVFWVKLLFAVLFPFDNVSFFLYMHSFINFSCCIFHVYFHPYWAVKKIRMPSFDWVHFCEYIVLLEIIICIFTIHIREF